MGLNFPFCKTWVVMLDDLQPPLSSKLLILCLQVNFFSVSWINQEENLAEKQGFYLYHFIIFASSPTLILLFQLRTLELLLIFASYTLYGQIVVILIHKHLLSTFQALPLLQILSYLTFTMAQAGRYYLQLI